MSKINKTILCECKCKRIPKRSTRFFIKYSREKFGASFLAVYLLFRLAPFAKNLLKEDEEELFVLLTALRSAGRRRKLARIQGFVEETVRFILATQL